MSAAQHKVVQRLWAMLGGPGLQRLTAVGPSTRRLISVRTILLMVLMQLLLRTDLGEEQLRSQAATPPPLA